MHEHQEQEAKANAIMFSVDGRIAARREQAEPDENAQEKPTPAGDAHANAYGARHPRPPIAHNQPNSSIPVGRLWEGQRPVSAPIDGAVGD
jgi:hypothetical protein